MISRFPKRAKHNSDHSLLESQLGQLLNYAQCLTGNRETAHDLVQSCALKALVARNIPTEEQAHKAWLFKILRNIFLDNLRKQASNDKVLRELSGNLLLDWNNPQEPNVYKIEQQKINILAVHDGLAKLKAGQRELLVLVDIAGFSYNEVADLLQIPVGTVMSRLSRARNALLQVIDGIHTGPVCVTATGKSK